MKNIRIYTSDKYKGENYIEIKKLNGRLIMKWTPKFRQN